MRGIAKSYGGVTALHGIDLDISAGEVLAVCGDNGAGKSSLIRIMSGAQAPDAGMMRLRDVAALASRVCILRAGRKVVDQPAAGLRAEDLVGMVMGDRAA